MSGGLGRKAPSDWRHVERYPLTARPPTSPMPCVLGIGWYQRFDSPQKDSKGRYWAAKPGDSLGSIRGGHAICVKPAGLTDNLAWWDFYNQGATGECVGFSESRMMTLVNRKRYKAPWLYMRATETDEWPGNDDDPQAGTSVRAGLEVLRTEGHERLSAQAPELAEGITAYRWATTVEEVHSIIQMPLAVKLSAVPLLNSWGSKGYPHIVWLPDEVLGRLLSENGEAVCVTDR